MLPRRCMHIAHFYPGMLCKCLVLNHRGVPEAGRVASASSSPSESYIICWRRLSSALSRPRSNSRVREKERAHRRHFSDSESAGAWCSLSWSASAFGTAQEASSPDRAVVPRTAPRRAGTAHAGGSGTGRLPPTAAPSQQLLHVRGAPAEGGGVRSGPGAARTILLFHIISARPSKQPLRVRTLLKVYMELGS